jgi:hypothetical protein
VLRWGHVNTGKRNGPAPPEATGWECDKLSPAGADTHFAGYIGRLAAKNGPVDGGLIQGMVLDSWECETQTWTLELPPSGSLFVVFRKTGQSAANSFVRLEHDGVTVSDAQAPYAAASGLQVVSATYGDPASPARRKDVTKLVRQDLARGVTAITANNDWAGGEPALKTVKELSIVMRLPGGQEKHLEAKEDEPLALVDPVATPHPACEVLDGGASLGRALSAGHHPSGEARRQSPVRGSDQHLVQPAHLRRGFGRKSAQDVDD